MTDTQQEKAVAVPAMKRESNQAPQASLDFRPDPQAPPRTRRQLIGDAVRDFLLPFNRHRKLWLISGVILLLTGATIGFFLAPKYFAERDAVAQEAKTFARHTGVDMGAEAGPYVEALKIHRRSVDEILGDLNQRLKATMLVKHMGRDYMAPLRAAQKTLEKWLPYEGQLKKEGKERWDISSFSDQQKKEAEIAAKQLIAEATKAFLAASEKIEARSTESSGLPEPNGPLELNEPAVLARLEIFNVSLAALELALKKGASLDELMHLAAVACMDSRVAQGSVEFGPQGKSVSVALKQKINAFSDDLGRLQAHTSDLAGRWPEGSTEAATLKRYSGSEERRLALLGAFIRNSYKRDFRTMQKIYDHYEQLEKEEAAAIMAAARK